MTKEIDFHGYTVEEAISILENIISKHFIKKEVVSYNLITGHGKIKQEFLKLLKEYDCEASISLGNSGLIIAHIGIEDY